MAVPTAEDMDLAGLTDEERAAIEDKPSDAEIAGLRSVAGDDDGDDGDDDGDDGDDDAATTGAGQPEEGKPAAAATTAAAADTGADTKADAKNDDAGKPAAVSTETTNVADDLRPGYVATLPHDFNERMGKLATEEADLRAKFKDGEIDVDAYDKQRDAIVQQRAELNRQSLKVEISQEMTEQNAKAAWTNNINRFFDNVAKTEGIDYRADKARNDALDDFIKVIASKTEHDDKPLAWFLQEAHKRVKAMFGDVDKPAVDTASTEAKPAAKAGDKKAEPASRKPPVAAAPQTLAQVPGGDGPGDVAGEFAHLDALNGDALEIALGKMSPEARDRYAKGL